MMPTVEGTRVRCPECGATVHAVGDVTRCEYCGTESRVQRRTQVFQMPIRLLPAPDVPQRVALQVRTRRWPVVLIMVFAIGIPIVAPLGLYFAAKKGVMDNMGWQSPDPVIGDVDGDGVEDAIGIARYVQADQMKLTAVSGKDGHTLWQTPSLGDYTSIYRSKLALVNGLVLRADTDKRANVEAYDAKTGAKKWRQTPSEVVDKLCRTPTGVMIVTKDKRGWTFDPNSGALSAAVAPQTCDEIGGDIRFRMSFDEPHRDVTIDGMSRSHTLGTQAPFIATGTKSPGSSIPMVAAFDAREHLLWKAEVPGTNPLGARQSAPDYVVLDDKDVAIVYERDDSHNPPNVVVFDRATGQRRFEVPTKVASESTVWLHGIALGKQAVFVVVDDALEAFDRTTGKLLWFVGTLR
jgi:outer membrane protein assembly factor BamB